MAVLQVYLSTYGHIHLYKK